MLNRFDRTLATMFCLLIGAICYSGKAATFALYALCACGLIYFMQQRRQLRQVFDGWATSGPFVFVLIFASYAGLSALWAVKPDAAIAAGMSLAANALACQFLILLIAILPFQTLVLISGWSFIGFLGGSLLLLYELTSGYAATIWVLNSLGVHFPLGKMVQLSEGNVTYIHYYVANWGVAAINILTWPTLLFVALTLEGRTRKSCIFAITVVAVVTTYMSDHETSQIALPIGFIIYLMAYRFPGTARWILMAGCVAMFVLIVPAAQTANRFSLDNADWASPSLKARFIIWGVTAELVQEAPILGIGARSTNAWREKHIPSVEAAEGRAYPPTTDSHAHNNYLQVWFELGGIGACLLAAVVISIISTIATMRREIAPFATAAAAVTLTICFATWDMWSNWLSALYSVVIVSFAIGNRLASARQNGAVISTFGSIWLPGALRTDKKSVEGAL